MARIAVDAMGGDHAPAAEIDAAVAAVREVPGALRVVLVGDETRVRAELARHGFGSDPRLAAITIQHASQVITMEDAPASAVRTKKDASMRVCFDLVKRGEADAVVSAGNSGAMLACGLFVLRRLKGVERPCIVTTFPTLRVPCVLCDMGANVDVKPPVLAQFGVLGAVYAQVVFGKARPRVGLLSNGEEESKGTELTRAAHPLLARTAEAGDFEYAGYVEGRDIFSGDLDVVATDGFTGNVVLKTAEGAALTVMKWVKDALLSTPRAKLGAYLARPALEQLRKKIDYAETGGAPLLGVDGVVMICHGSSTSVALKNAVFAADRFVMQGLAPKLAAAIARAGLLSGAPADGVAADEDATSEEQGRSAHSEVRNDP